MTRDGKSSTTNDEGLPLSQDAECCETESPSGWSYFWAGSGSGAGFA
jgi:hypothetical protein